MANRFQPVADLLLAPSVDLRIRREACPPDGGRGKERGRHLRLLRQRLRLAAEVQGGGDSTADQQRHDDERQV